MPPFTLIDDATVHTLTARSADGRIVLPAEDVRRALGWELKPEGLCREGVCVPVADRAALVGPEGLALDALARTLDRPLALDVDEQVAHLGVAAAARGRALASLEAPDFTLPDLDGTPHTLSDYRGKKVLLVAYASW